MHPPSLLVAETSHPSFAYRPAIPDAAQLEIRTKLVQTALAVNAAKGGAEHRDQEQSRKRRRIASEVPPVAGNSNGGGGGVAASKRGKGTRAGSESRRAPSMRLHVVAGINQVTKGLERGELG